MVGWFIESVDNNDQLKFIFSVTVISYQSDGIIILGFTGSTMEKSGTVFRFNIHQKISHRILPDLPPPKNNFGMARGFTYHTHYVEKAVSARLTTSSVMLWTVCLILVMRKINSWRSGGLNVGNVAEV